MTALFPTFGNLLQRAKRLLSTDTRDIWQQICDRLADDEERYIRECRAKGLEHLLGTIL
jgi:hypothetical protein